MGLWWCDDCKENSMKVKVYVQKLNKGQATLFPPVKKRVMFCVNKGCGNRIDLPPVKQGNTTEVN